MKIMLIAAAAALTLAAGTAFAESGANNSSENSLPMNFNAGNVTYQTAKRMQNYVAEHEKAALADQTRQQPHAISAARGGPSALSE
jgi:hypothetical protein